jgi:quercetin dioxygenase-like cupin family protein
MNILPSQILFRYAKPVGDSANLQRTEKIVTLQTKINGEAKNRYRVGTTKSYTMKKLLSLTALAGFLIVVQSCSNGNKNNNEDATTDTSKAQDKNHVMDSVVHALNIRFDTMKWGKMVPELGERSPEITILHIDPKTQATQLMIREPKNLHVPMHWHTANETITVISGTLIMGCEGKRDTLNPGSFNYTPATMQHQAWTTNKEGALVFITVDKAWDVNWVGGPPKPEDFIVK